MNIENPHPAATLAQRAEALVPEFASRAAAHDRDNSFVAENIAALKAAGLAKAAVPVDLGGEGADAAQMCEVLRILAHGCPSTALCFAMHSHQVVIPAWRWQHRPETRPLVEPLLRRVASEGLILVSSGGSDWIAGSGKAEKVPGGYKITARKIFASISPIGDLLITSAISEEDGARKVVHFALPMNTPEVHIRPTWDAMGMRGTGSNDIDIDGAFVPDEKIAFKRNAGEWHPLFHIITTQAYPMIYAVYLGVAEAARDLAIDLARRKSVDARTRRAAGEMDTALAAARYASAAMIAQAGRSDPGPATVNAVMIGRRLVEEAAIRAVNLAMDTAGGVSFYRSAGLERLLRDVQGARFHPMLPEVQYEYAGAMAFGQPTEMIF